ncbi:tail fiber [Citromicrobium phage vB_CbaS-RXM]|nr:tail fiber [Citromicrobium phage vB_CbaS-RXM]
MPNTPLLGITQVSASQSSKEVTINDAILALENATNAKRDVSFASATTVTLTATEATRSFIYIAKSATAASTLNIPNQINGTDFTRLFAVRNESGQGLTVKFTTGAGASVVIPNGQTRLLAALEGTNIIVAAEPQAAINFLALDDTPSSFVGVQGKFLGVNVEETALVFLDAATFPAYAANAGKTLVVNATEDGVEWADIEAVAAFTDLTDTPGSFAGAGGKLVAVKSDASGIEFIDQPETEAVEFQSAQVWRVRATQPGIDPQVGFGEVEFLNDNGINLVGSGTASASSFETGYEPEFAFDGDLSAGAGWRKDPEAVGDDWIAYDFGAPVTVRQVRLSSIFAGADYSPLQFAIEYKSGEDWIEAGVRTAEAWADGVSQTFKVKGFPLSSIPDAPDDGQQYARQNRAWVPFEAGVGLSESVEVAAAVSNLLASQSTQYLRFTSNSAKTLTVQPDATEEMPSNGEWHFQNEGNNNLTITVGAGVTINAPVDGSLVIPKGGTASLKRVAVDTYNLFGVTVSTAEETGLEDAPSDGSLYGRKDGNWEQVPDAGGGGTSSSSSTTLVVPETARDLANTDIGKYLRFTATSAKTLTVRPEATEAITQDGEFFIRNVGAGDLTITAGAGVTINTPAGGSLVVPASGGTATLKRVAEDEFDLLGQTVTA